MRKALVCLTALLFLLCVMPPLHAENETQTTQLMENEGSPYPSTPAPPPTPEAMIMDLLFVRPISFIALAVGAGASILATPFALASGTTGVVYRRLVVQPYDFTVCRPLGQF